MHAGALEHGQRSLGDVDLAERALAVLSADGMHVAVRPSSLISYSPGRRQRLQADWTYAYRHAKVSARSAALRVRFAVRAGSR